MDKIQVELVYIHAVNEHFYVAMQVPVGTTIHALVDMLDLAAHYPEVDIHQMSCGVYGKVQPASYVLQYLDRVELYRPLTLSPLDARKIRAQRKHV